MECVVCLIKTNWAVSPGCKDRGWQCGTQTNISWAFLGRPYPSSLPNKPYLKQSWVVTSPFNSKSLVLRSSQHLCTGIFTKLVAPPTVLQPSLFPCSQIHIWPTASQNTTSPIKCPLKLHVLETTHSWMISRHTQASSLSTQWTQRGRTYSVIRPFEWTEIPQKYMCSFYLWWWTYICYL